MKCSINILLFLLIGYSNVYSQSSDSVEIQPVNKKGLRRAVIGSAIVYGGTLYGLSKVWYEDSPSESFHFFNDNHEWKQVDKIGHFYSSFYLSYGFSKGLQHYHVPERKADLIGALCGFAVMVPIEILDGYETKYGASVGDLIADASGPLLYLLEKRLWKEVRIIPKFSFHRTDYAQLRPEVLGSGFDEILKDYNGQTYWLSVDMDKFMRFPKWLNLAVGYGAEGMVYAHDWETVEAGYPPPYRQYYLSVDWDLTAIKTNSKFVKTVLFFANMIKLPAPTLILTEKGAQMDWFYY
jgi:hypothetical protein